MKVDILVFAAHPDDAELSCSGTIAAHVAMGYKCAIVDMTKGEMGTRGTPELRMQEAADSAKILGLSARENLGFEDVKFTDDWQHQMTIVRMLRKYQPDVVLANAIADRHPDHAKAARLVQQAVFKAGLKKVSTKLDGIDQEAHRPRRLYHFIQTDYIEPDLIVDISKFWDTKWDSMMAFKSQFYDPRSSEPETFISSPRFLEFIKARATEFGHRIGVQYGEGFTTANTPGIADITSLI
jgi:bacillithiol biosynthesis deacetylase BshB1